MRIRGICNSGEPTTKEWIMLVLDVPEYWNRVIRTIEDGQNKNCVLPLTVDVDKLSKLHNHWRIPIRLFWSVLLPIASFFLGGFLLQ